MLGTVAVFGLFNRITFPAFLLIPSLRLIPHFLTKYVLHYTSSRNEPSR